MITSQPSPDCALFAPNIARRVLHRANRCFTGWSLTWNRCSKASHPLPGNDAKVRELLDQSLRGKHMGLNTRREPDGIYFSYNVAVLVAEPGSACAKLPSSITSS